MLYLSDSDSMRWWEDDKGSPLDKRGSEGISTSPSFFS